MSKLEKIQRYVFMAAIAACIYQIWNTLGVYLITNSAGIEPSESAGDRLVGAISNVDEGNVAVGVSLLAVYVLYAVATYGLYKKAENKIHDFKLVIPKSVKSAVWSWFIPFGLLYLPRRRLKELEAILILNQPSGFISGLGSGIGKTRDFWWFGSIGFLIIGRAVNPILADIEDPKDWSSFLSSINYYALVIALEAVSLIISYVFGIKYFQELFRMEELLEDTAQP